MMVIKMLVTSRVITYCFQSQEGELCNMETCLFFLLFSKKYMSSIRIHVNLKRFTPPTNHYHSYILF